VSLSIHSDVKANGTRFGDAYVTVDEEAGDAVLVVDVVGMRLQRFRYHSLEEVVAAHAAQRGRAAFDHVARDVCSALSYAGKRLRGSFETKAQR
jgi:hypothetical protein